MVGLGLGGYWSMLISAYWMLKPCSWMLILGGLGNSPSRYLSLVGMSIQEHSQVVFKHAHTA